MTKLKKKQAELEVIEMIMNNLEFRVSDWKWSLESHLYETNEDGIKIKKEIDADSWEAREIEELTAKLEAVDAITEYLEKRI